MSEDRQKVSYTANSSESDILHKVRAASPVCYARSVEHDLTPGDFLIFQLEAGFALLRLLAIDEADGILTWHVAAYDEFFPSIESAEVAAGDGKVTVSRPHIALTTRAVESTQLARIASAPLGADELAHVDEWRSDPSREVSDRSIRLMLGLR